MPSPRWPLPDLRALLRLRATRLALGGVFLIACALAASAALTLSYALSPKAFTAMAGEGFERELRVESVELEMLRGRPRIRVAGLEIEGLGGAEAAEIELRVRPLLRGRVKLRRVHLLGPKLVLHRGPDGAFLPLFQRSDGDGDLSGVPAFEADNGEIRIVQGEKLTAVVRIRSLILGRFDRKNRANLLLAGNVSGGDGRWHTHPLHLMGDLVHAPGQVALENGRARARHVAANWWSGSDARARFAYRNGRIEIASLDVKGFGGQWHVRGRAWISGGMRLDLTAHAEGIDFASLLSAADGRGPETDADLGVLRMRWSELHVPWRGGPRFDLGTGEGELYVTGGVLPGTSVLGSLVRLEPAPTPVESFEAPVVLADNRLHTEGMRLATGDYVLEAAGSVGFDRSVALDGTVNLQGDLLVPGAAAVLPTVPVTIAGELPHPDVDAHVVRATAPIAVVKRTGETLGRGTRAVGETLGAGARKLGGGISAVGRSVGGAIGR